MVKVTIEIEIDDPSNYGGRNGPFEQRITEDVTWVLSGTQGALGYWIADRVTSIEYKYDS